MLHFTKVEVLYIAPIKEPSWVSIRRLEFRIHMGKPHAMRVGAAVLLGYTVSGRRLHVHVIAAAAVLSSRTAQNKQTGLSCWNQWLVESRCAKLASFESIPRNFKVAEVLWVVPLTCEIQRVDQRNLLQWRGSDETSFRTVEPR